MQWPFKTTVCFASPDGKLIRLQYAVAAMSERDAKSQLEQRLRAEELVGYIVEDVVPATGREAAQLKFPDNCVQLLG